MLDYAAATSLFEAGRKFANVPDGAAPQATIFLAVAVFALADSITRLSKEEKK